MGEILQQILWHPPESKWLGHKLSKLCEKRKEKENKLNPLPNGVFFYWKERKMSWFFCVSVFHINP